MNVESGLNDGICVPVFFIVLGIAQAEEGAIGNGAAARLIAEEIGYGILAGAIAEVAAAGVVILARRRGFVERSWLQIVPLAGAGLAYGIASPLGGSGFIAAFVGGLVFGALRQQREVEVEYLIEEGGAILSGLTFIVFGATLLEPALNHVTVSAMLYAVPSLTLVRMVPVAIAMLGTGARRPTVGFLGWFGPRGLASIVFAIIVLEEGGLPHDTTMLETVYITIGLSVLAHGLSAAQRTAVRAGTRRTREGHDFRSKVSRYTRSAGGAGSGLAQLARALRDAADVASRPDAGTRMAGAALAPAPRMPRCLGLAGCQAP